MTCPKEHIVGNLYTCITPLARPGVEKNSAIWKPTEFLHLVKANVPMILAAIGVPNNHFGIFLYNEQLVEIPWIHVVLLKTDIDE